MANPVLLEADKDASYYETIEINMDEITEPILCAPNDPDDARLLSEVTGEKIDEVFIGSCMTNIGHFRAAGKMLEAFEGQLPTRLWVAPPTKMDAALLSAEGYYSIYGKAGARTEMPGCSLCMGNQARVADKATVVSTSTKDGQCTENPGYMNLHCAVSCGVCTGTCKDTHNDCPGWASDGECVSNPGSVLKQCPNSCSVCKE